MNLSPAANLTPAASGGSDRGAGSNNGCSSFIYCTVCQLLPLVYQRKSFYSRPTLRSAVVLVVEIGCGWRFWGSDLLSDVKQQFRIKNLWISIGARLSTLIGRPMPRLLLCVCHMFCTLCTYLYRCNAYFLYMCNIHGSSIL